MHKRAAAATPLVVADGNSPIVVANGSGGMNGHVTTPLLAVNNDKTQQRRRRKRRQRRPSEIVGDWIACFLAVLVLMGCGYWMFTKMFYSSGSGSEDDASSGSGGGMQRHKHKEGKSPMRKLKPMPFNQLYHLPESHALVGDRSDKYAKTRQHYDHLLPYDLDRSVATVRHIREQQDANDYNVVPIVSAESHRSLHQHHDDEEGGGGGSRPRKHHHHHHGGESREMEEGNNSNDQEEESKLIAEEVYDIYNCPDEPVDGYPYAWPILTLLDNWSPDDTTIPDIIYQGLCVFDYQKDHDKAMTYRKAELPFIVQNDPEVARSVERWNYPGFMQDLTRGVKHRCEYSPNNHFMYHLPPKGGRTRPGDRVGRLWNKTPKDYKPPTDLLRMTYIEWLEHANITDGAAAKGGSGGHNRDDDAKDVQEDDVEGPEHEHWYFRLIGCGLTGPDGSCDKGSSEYLFDELPFFQPVDNLYLAKGDQQKGIHCRFGMKGVIAENHFDGSRNAIVLLGGSRRYILAHPDQCEALSLFPVGHPSARHSQIDFTHPDLEKFPDFARANANEVILQPGDVLYLPTHWFHYIVSLELNFQCNSRSGIGYEYEQVINECGF